MYLYYHQCDTITTIVQQVQLGSTLKRTLFQTSLFSSWLHVGTHESPHRRRPGANSISGKSDISSARHLAILFGKPSSLGESTCHLLRRQIQYRFSYLIICYTCVTTVKVLYYLIQSCFPGAIHQLGQVLCFVYTYCLCTPQKRRHTLDKCTCIYIYIYNI